MSEVAVSPKEKVSVVTILHGNEEFIPLLLNNFKGFKDTQELELVIVDDGPTSQAVKFADVPNCLYIHLNQEEIEKFSDQILEGYKQPNKSPAPVSEETQDLAEWVQAGLRVRSLLASHDVSHELRLRLFTESNRSEDALHEASRCRVHVLRRLSLL